MLKGQSLTETLVKRSRAATTYRRSAAAALRRADAALKRAASVATKLGALSAFVAAERGKAERERDLAREFTRKAEIEELL